MHSSKPYLYKTRRKKIFWYDRSNLDNKKKITITKIVFKTLKTTKTNFVYIYLFSYVYSSFALYFLFKNNINNLFIYAYVKYINNICNLLHKSMQQFNEVNYINVNHA